MQTQQEGATRASLQGLDLQNSRFAHLQQIQARALTCSARTQSAKPRLKSTGRTTPTAEPGRRGTAQIDLRAAALFLNCYAHLVFREAHVGELLASYRKRHE